VKRVRDRDCSTNWALRSALCRSPSLASAKRCTLWPAVRRRPNATAVGANGWKSLERRRARDDAPRRRPAEQVIWVALGMKLFRRWPLARSDRAQSRERWGITQAGWGVH